MIFRKIWRIVYPRIENIKLFQRFLNPNPYMMSIREEATNLVRTADMLTVTSIAEASDLKSIDVALAKSAKMAQRATKMYPDWPEAYKCLAQIIWFQGKCTTAIPLLIKAEKLSAETPHDKKKSAKQALVLPHNTATGIGMMGHMEYVIKKNIMEGNRFDIFFRSHENGKVANSVFSKYFHKLVILHENPDLLLEYDYVSEPNCHWVFSKINGEYDFSHIAFSDIQKTWENKGLGPLLKLDPDHFKILQKYRKKSGMSDEDWFVCFHVRSGEYYTESENDLAQRHRNTPIKDYYDAMQSVIHMGGHVVRMGDGSMDPISGTFLKKNKNRVHDYACSKMKSPELDIALSATCELFVSANSGLHAVAHAFGRKVCHVNLTMYAGFPWHPGELYSFQRMYSEKLKRYLSLFDIFTNDYQYFDHTFMYMRKGISFTKNSPEEIRETVIEALQGDSYNTDVQYSAAQVHGFMNKLRETFPSASPGLLSSHFSMKHSLELLRK